VALSSSPTVLAVFAHPDDESLSCGGTLARLSDRGARVVLFCASRGERGSETGPEWNARLGQHRARELAAAAGILGIRDILQLDHPDGDLRWANVAELHAHIVLAIRHYRPEAVITFGDDGLYWHQDHIGVYERTLTAVRCVGDAVPALYHVTMPPGAMRGVEELARSRGWVRPAHGLWSLTPDAFGDAAKPPTLVVDVRDWVARKLDAIRCHHSQEGKGHPFEKVTDEEARRWLGVEHFHHGIASGSGRTIMEEIAE
jgi:LmbE family N-acetylglucosaminyl deacetylase